MSGTPSSSSPSPRSVSSSPRSPMMMPSSSSSSPTRRPRLCSGARSLRDPPDHFDSKKTVQTKGGFSSKRGRSTPVGRTLKAEERPSRKTRLVPTRKIPTKDAATDGKATPPYRYPGDRVVNPRYQTCANDVGGKVGIWKPTTAFRRTGHFTNNLLGKEKESSTGMNFR